MRADCSSLFNFDFISIKEYKNEFICINNLDIDKTSEYKRKVCM